MFCHTRKMMGIRHALRQVRRAVAHLPLPIRFAVVAAVVLGVLGGMVGLAVGLISYPPTAWFAVLEVGVPAGLLGAIAGLMGGFAASLVRRGHPGSHVS